tara:strand:- start:63 stop:473 length:411 start_codon:yes stop_codon:yes gene_type:complete
MGTRSRIGLELSDGSILSVYHHWDGYPSWLGRILKTHYNSYEKAENLIDGGDMSSCWTNEQWSNDLLDRNREKYGANYYSYRGEDCPPRLDKNLNEYVGDGEEYAYLYTLNGEWVCYDLHETLKMVEIPSEIPLAV